MEINDFWKVESMSGTYITSIMNEGKHVMKLSIVVLCTYCRPVMLDDDDRDDYGDSDSGYIIHGNSDD